MKTRRAEWLAGLLALAAAVWLTQRGLPSRPYFSQADLYYFIANPNLWNLSHWRQLFTSDYGVQFSGGGFYHPLACALYMAVSQAFGNDPWAFRLLQTILVWATAALLAAGERRRLGLWAWAAALLFVIHPMNAALEIVGIRDQLVVFFFLAGLSLRRWSAPRKSSALRFLPAGAFALALLSKEIAVVFPALLLADDWTEGRLDDRAGRREAAGVLAACLLVLAAYASFRFRMFPSVGLGYAPGESLVSIARRGLEFLTRISCAPPPWAAAALTAGILLLAARSRRLAAEYAGWLAVGLVFYSGLLPLRNLSALISVTSREPHRLFVPAVGFVLLLALAFRECRGRFAAGLIPAAAAAVLAAAFVRGRLQPHVPDYSEALPALSFNRRHSPQSVPGQLAALKDDFGDGGASLLESYYDGALAEPCRAVALLRTVWIDDASQLVSRVEAGLAYRRGAAAAAAGEWGEAESEYRESISLDGGDAAARRGLAAALWSRRGRPEALKEALAGAKIEESDFMQQNSRCAIPGEDALDLELTGIRAPEFPLRLAVLERLGGENAESFELLKNLARKKPRDFDVWLQLGRTALADGRPDVVDAAAKRASALAAGADQRRGLDELLKAASRPFPESASRPKPSAVIKMKLAVLCRRAGWNALAVELLQSLVRDRPDDFEARLQLIDSALAAGRRDVAETSLDFARTLAVTPLQRRRLADAYLQIGAYPRAVELLRGLAKENPSDPGLFKDLGVSEFLGGDPKAAAASLETAIRLDPELLPAYVSLASVDAALRRYDEALRVDDRALAIKSGDAALREMILKDRSELEKKTR
jgi:tetratricopeptide (TPR) repeat protein